MSDDGTMKFNTQTKENTLNKFGVPTGANNSRHGILMPALAYRFRVMIEGNTDDWDEDATAFLAQQIVDCDMDYRNDLVGVTLRQPITGPMQEYIRSFCAMGIKRLTLETLDGSNQGVIYAIVFKNLEVLQHYSKYDYASSDCVTHGLKCQFSTMEVIQKLQFTK